MLLLVVVSRHSNTSRTISNSDEEYYEGNVTDVTEVHSAHALVPDVE
jgi:hypothetical protein